MLEKTNKTIECIAEEARSIPAEQRTEMQRLAIEVIDGSFRGIDSEPLDVQEAASFMEEEREKVLSSHGGAIGQLQKQWGKIDAMVAFEEGFWAARKHYGLPVPLLFARESPALEVSHISNEEFATIIRRLDAEDDEIIFRLS